MEDTPIRALLIEDDPEDALLLRAMLKEVPTARIDLGHVPRLDAAIELAGGEDFDVALLDLSLPDSRGLETFIGLHRALPELPIVVLTGIDDHTLAEKAVREGAQDYLVKGQVDGGTLLRSIRYAIVRQRASQYRSLLRARERFDTAVSQMTDGIIVTEGDLRISSANRAACLLLNLPEEPWKLTLSAAISGFWLSEPVETLLESTAHDTAFEIARKDTHPPLYLDARLSRIFDSDGNLDSTVLVLRDVTDNKLSRHVQASFITTVPHKLRTPLALLGGYLQLAKHMPPDQLAREWPHVSSVCEAEVESLSAIVQKLLEFEALSTWQLQEAMRHADVVAVAQTAADKVRERYPDRELDLAVEATDDARYADCTEEHLEFILDELIGNAVKFAEKDRVQVRLSVAPGEDGLLAFSVTDDGPGIPHEYFDRIFEGFVQVEEHVTGQIPGLGIGLRLVRQIVEACGGGISVRSQLGEGSTFEFTLPIPADAEG